LKEKKTILHIAHDLGRGGAETILVTTVNELQEYRNVVVTFKDVNEFGNEFTCDQYICLHVKHPLLFPFYALKLRRIIRQQKVDIVHSRLFWATLTARLGTPKRIPLVTTIHAYIASSLEYKKWFIRWLDKLTYRWRNTIMMADSKGALDEYFSFLKLKPYKAISPYTFVDIRKFNQTARPQRQPGAPIRLISVGRLTQQKNHRYLIAAFTHLQGQSISLDIYGMNVLYDELQQLIAEKQVAVRLMGQVSNINEIIPQYDIFVMPSLYEGFSLAVLEAMAMGMPLMLSDIASFREQCADTARYFDLHNPADFAAQLLQLATNPQQLEQLGQAAKDRVLQHFTLTHHMQVVRQVYADALQQTNT
jgi:glycosyltransferase involved in cell wall biosynthesis